MNLFFHRVNGKEDIYEQIHREWTTRKIFMSIFTESEWQGKNGCWIIGAVKLIIQPLIIVGFQAKGIASKFKLSFELTIIVKTPRRWEFWKAETKKYKIGSKPIK